MQLQLTTETTRESRATRRLKLRFDRGISRLVILAGGGLVALSMFFLPENAGETRASHCKKRVKKSTPTPFSNKCTEFQYYQGASGLSAA
jgi:hypothetical protein